MKIITWNCNLKFKQKFELISSYDPDICFVQECENLNSDFFPGYKYFWTGRNENKGLGILTKGDDFIICLLYTSPSPRDATLSRMPSSA